MYKKIYDTLIFKYPFLFLIVATIFVSYLSYNAKDVQIDASAETLLLEDDEDLKFFRESFKKYENSNFLIVTYSPKKNLLDDETLKNIKSISDEFLELENIAKVDSIITVPLLQSPIRPISDLVAGVDSLSSKEFDKNLVEQEFLNSPLYKNALVSSDFKTTAIILHLKDDKEYFNFIEKREKLLAKESLNAKEKEELEENSIKFKEYRELSRQKETKDIEEIREIIKNYENDARIFLGGVSMIANDAVHFVKNDLIIYGFSLVFIFIFILYYI